MTPLIGLVGTVLANGPEDLGSIPGHVIPKTLKMAQFLSGVKLVWTSPCLVANPSLVA